MTNLIQAVERAERRVRIRSDRLQALGVAVAFAQAFIDRALAETAGEGEMEPAAIVQLAAALHAIPDPEQICSCGHDHFSHEGTTGGICLVPGCGCGMFEPS